jgi:hypothetical protein
MKGLGKYSNQAEKITPLTKAKKYRKCPRIIQSDLEIGN